MDALGLGLDPDDHDGSSCELTRGQLRELLGDAVAVGFYAAPPSRMVVVE